MAMESPDDLSEDSLMKALWDSKIQIYDVNTIIHPAVADYVKEQSNVRGYPALFMVGNLFTVTAHVLGKSTFEVIPNGWKEAIVGFTAMVGQRGSNKSGASADAIDMIVEFSKLAEADEKAAILAKINRELLLIGELQNNEQGDQEAPPQKKIKLDRLRGQLKKVKSSTFQKYHSNLTPTMMGDVLARGDGNIVMVQDEMASFFKALNSGGRGDKDPKSYFCSLYGGSRVKGGDPKSKNGEVDIENPRVQVCGYIQPDVFTELVATRGDGQGVYDRLTILCPVPELMDFDQMCQAKSTVTIHLEALLLGIAYSHSTARVYTMSDSARLLFSTLTKKHNEMLVENKYAGSLQGLLRKMETKTLRSAVVNAALRVAVERQMAEEKLTEDKRWNCINLSTTSREEKIKKASEGRVYLVEESDMQLAINLQTYSMELYKIIISFANDLQRDSGSKSKKALQKTPIGGRNIGNPQDMDLNYAIDHIEKIQGIYSLKEDADGKVKGSAVSTAKFFPQLRIQGATSKDKVTFFLEALHHLGVVIYDKEKHLLQKVKESDNEETRSVFEALSQESKGEFNPLKMVQEGGVE